MTTVDNRVLVVIGSRLCPHIDLVRYVRCWHLTSIVALVHVLWLVPLEELLLVQHDIGEVLSSSV